MLKWNGFIRISLLTIISVTPVLADSKNPTDAKVAVDATANAAAQPAANSSLTPAGGANVTALLGLLVMKGVLAPAEANAIWNAAPEAEFKMLVEALARKGVVSAADLTSSPSAQPNAEVNTAPLKAVEVTAQAAAQTAPAAPEKKIPPPTVVSAVAPLRVL